MLTKSQEIHYMVDMLPEEEQSLAFEMIKRLVLAWDPDFTKLTPSEKRQLDLAQAEMDKGEYYTHDEAMKELGLL